MIEKRCPRCGCTLSVFYKTSMLGCPYCYETFFDEIENVLLKIQGKTEHTGKVPCCDDEGKELLAEYEYLFSERENAARRGDFAEMGRISKRMTALYNELQKRGLK